MEKNHVTNVEEMAEEQSFLMKNWKKLSMALGAVVILVLACIGYVKLVSEPREAKAADALAPCQTQIANQQYKEAIPALQAVVSQYGSTKAGNLAQAYLGIAYYNEGNYTEAIEALKKYDADEDFVAGQAASALANCYACNKEYDKAVEAFEKAAKLSTTPSVAASYLIQAGQICESQGNKDQALKLYQQVKDEYKTSGLSAEVDKYIERAKN